MNTLKYFQNLEKEVRGIYAIAEEARKKNLDPIGKVEIPLAMSMAEKVVGLISTIYPQMMGSGIAERIHELENQWGKLDPAVCLQISEEIAKQKFCKFENLLQSIDAGARVAFAYITLGVVSSPIEGLTEIKIMKTLDGKEYLSPYFSGPVRSAGGTGAAFSLVIIDHLREIFGFAKYDPTEEEVKRAVTELLDYHERITNLQYMPTEEEIILLAKNLPLQVNGEASEKLEVSNHKNVPRIETNFIRGGFCLVLGEGIAQKAAKIKRYISGLREKGFKLSDWNFLDEFIELHKKRDLGKLDASPTYIKDLVAGRPVFGHPSRSGAFRFRYGRGRVSGFSAASLHPATMAVTDDFIAIGTQLKIEKPTKGMTATVCDSIEGPIVKLVNGSVKKLKSIDEARKLYPEINEIIYLGDILFPFSDLANRNASLIKPGYVEEWWGLDLEKADPPLRGKINFLNISFEESVEFSKKYNIPLYPKNIFYWNEINLEQFKNLIEWLNHSRCQKKIIFPFTKLDEEKFSLGKRALELIGLEHEVTLENVVINELNSKRLFLNLGLDCSLFDKSDFLFSEVFDKEDFDKISNINQSVLEIINFLSKFKIKDKSGDFIGSRMGRPEKAKLRKLQGSPNILFPVGSEGGRLRSVNAALVLGKVNSNFPSFFCDSCKKETIYFSCEVCGNICKLQEEVSTDFKRNNKKTIDLKYYLDHALKKLNMSRSELPLLIKGIRGTSSDNHIVENLSKGILRAQYNLQVNKDGTIRYDATELPIVSFKPKEILTSISKLKELGYDKDIYGNELINDSQIIELMPHDILLPSATENRDEKADDVFINVCNFIDDLLVKFYKLPPFYNVKSRDDLIGQLGVVMAPHNCAGVACRFIGFSNSLGLFASPFMHAAVRRDCDGDEAAIMLLGDVLLNFSRQFLPNHRGGTQDAPLVLNAHIDAGEVDDQILDFEYVYEYPLELYELAEKREHSSKFKIYNLKKILKENKDPFTGYGFTHDTTNFNDGVICSSYKTLATMQDKVRHQMELVEKIRSADTSDTARLIIDRHFISDMKGNLRKFSMQGFRCVECNEIMRRPPLSGVCPVCKGKIIFTIHEGGIRKYLEPALDLVKKYQLSPYMKQSVELIKEAIESIFGKETEKQETISKWF